jgi:hypothetical protein
MVRGRNARHVREFAHHAHFDGELNGSIVGCGLDRIGLNDHAINKAAVSESKDSQPPC